LVAALQPVPLKSGSLRDALGRIATRTVPPVRCGRCAGGVVAVAVRRAGLRVQLHVHTCMHNGVAQEGARPAAQRLPLTCSSSITCCPLPHTPAGLEVKVAFGGVWKDSLSELSGGQKSLLALSLILAMLLFKPAPIYILDEVGRLETLHLEEPMNGFAIWFRCCSSKSLRSQAWETSRIALPTPSRIASYLSCPGGRRAGPEPHPEHWPHDQAALPAEPGAGAELERWGLERWRAGLHASCTMLGTPHTPGGPVRLQRTEVVCMLLLPPYSTTLTSAYCCYCSPSSPVCGGVAEGGHVQQRQRHLPHQVCGRGELTFLDLVAHMRPDWGNGAAVACRPCAVSG